MVTVITHVWIDYLKSLHCVHEWMYEHTVLTRNYTSTDNHLLEKKSFFFSFCHICNVTLSYKERYNEPNFFSTVSVFHLQNG